MINDTVLRIELTESYISVIFDISEVMVRPKSLIECSPDELIERLSSLTDFVLSLDPELMPFMVYNSFGTRQRTVELFRTRKEQARKLLSYMPECTVEIKK